MPSGPGRDTARRMSVTHENLDVVLKRFEAPDETRVFEKGRFEIVQVGGMTIGRATYEPAWKWSVHVGSKLGQALCDDECSLAWRNLSRSERRQKNFSPDDVHGRTSPRRAACRRSEIDLKPQYRAAASVERISSFAFSVTPPAGSTAHACAPRRRR